jgi:hypothetical protein
MYIVCVPKNKLYQKQNLCTWLLSEEYHNNKKNICCLVQKQCILYQKQKKLYLALVRRVPRRSLKGAVVGDKEEGGGHVVRHVG